MRQEDAIEGTALAHVQATVRGIAGDLRQHLHAPAMLIGSAAACLIGAETTVADLDLLVTMRDAMRLETVWAVHRDTVHAPTDGDRFRSRFARYHFTQLPVEVMGDLEVCVDGRWQRLQVIDTVPVAGCPDRLRVPTVPEQRRVLALFGRDKDRVRAAQLESLAATGAPP